MESVYTSHVTRCPRGKSEIFFIWDRESGEMRAGVKRSESAAQKAVQDAYGWCSGFNLRRRRFRTFQQASRFVERYDTWFEYTKD